MPRRQACMVEIKKCRSAPTTVWIILSHSMPLPRRATNCWHTATANYITFHPQAFGSSLSTGLPDFEGHRELVGMQPGDVPVTYADSTGLENDYGFKPTIGIREGL